LVDPAINTNLTGHDLGTVGTLVPGIYVYPLENPAALAGVFVLDGPAARMSSE
jgi:hypothetical protein